MPTNTDRFLLLIVWALAVGHGLIGGTDPGFRPLSAGFDYPWWPVARVCAVVTVECLALYVVLRRAPFPRRSQRAFVAAALAFALVAFEMFFQHTDQAGWAYTNAVFAGVATVMLIGYALGLAGSAGESSEHVTPPNAA
jgi:branched-subunit amino acid transport protein